MEYQTLKNSHLELHALPAGAAMRSLYVKDRHGNPVNVIFGYADIEKYKTNPEFLGATCGRFAGRIGGHTFTINNVNYLLESVGAVHLHGGKHTLGLKEWEVESLVEGEDPSVTYCLTSAHLEGGYPGRLVVRARYTLEGNRLKIEFFASSDADTHLNLTNHNYYNLNGSGSIQTHQLQVGADSFLELGKDKVPTGEFISLQGHRYDLRQPKLLQNLNPPDLDDVFVLNPSEQAAALYAPESGIRMKVTTNQPGMVVYTPANLSHGPYNNPTPADFPAICLETQHFPDSPNKGHFPSTLLAKGEEYYHCTVLEFGNS